MKDKVKNAHNNKSQKIGRGCYQANSYPKILDQEKKKARMEIVCYTRGYA